MRPHLTTFRIKQAWSRGWRSGVGHPCESVRHPRTTRSDGCEARRAPRVCRSHRGKRMRHVPCCGMEALGVHGGRRARRVALISCCWSGPFPRRSSHSTFFWGGIWRPPGGLATHRSLSMCQNSTEASGRRRPADTGRSRTMDAREGSVPWSEDVQSLEPGSPRSPGSPGR